MQPKCTSRPGGNPVAKESDLQEAQTILELNSVAAHIPDPRGGAELEVPAFPLEVLPGAARKLVETGAQSLGCPVDFVAVAVLAVLATAVGTRRRIRVKSGWIECACLYAAMVGSPGSGKSPAQALAMQPLYAYQERLMQRYREEVKAFRDHERKQVSGNDTAAEGHKPEPTAFPQAHQIYATDGTTEALALALRENPHGLLYLTDELTALTGGFNRYRRGVGADRQFFQTIWTGQPYMVNRVQATPKGRRLEMIEILRPLLNLLGGIQPDLLSELSDERNREDGFIHRFLFSYPPEMPTISSQEEISPDVLEEYEQQCQELLELPMSLTDEGIGFDAEGKEAWLRLASRHAEETNDPSLPDYLVGPYRKLEAYAARFAVILHLARYVTDPEGVGCEIDEKSVMDAWALVGYFKGHARKVYRQLRREPGNDRVAVLLDWIVAQGGTVTAREVYTARIAGCRTAGNVMELFERLRQMGLGQMESQNRSLIFKLNQKECRRVQTPVQTAYDSCNS